MKILLDVDGVIADFDQVARSVHGITDAQVGKHKGVWEWPPLVGLSMNRFWRKIDYYSFWVNIPPYPGAKRFVANLRKRGEVMFCTTPGHGAAGAAAKIEWLRTFIGPKDTMDYIICGSHKHWLADNCTVLIDDRDKNCEDFIAHGGHAILVPRPWNALHKRDNAVYGKVDYKYILTQLDQLIDSTIGWYEKSGEEATHDNR